MVLNLFTGVNYPFFKNCVSLITRLLQLVGGWVPVNWFYHITWVAVVTPTDRPMSVRNRCVVEVFGGVFVLSRCVLDFLWV